MFTHWFGDLFGVGIFTSNNGFGYIKWQGYNSFAFGPLLILWKGK
jgi:hypothetical protein